MASFLLKEVAPKHNLLAHPRAIALLLMTGYARSSLSARTFASGLEDRKEYKTPIIFFHLCTYLAEWIWAIHPLHMQNIAVPPSKLTVKD